MIIRLRVPGIRTRRKSQHQRVAVVDGVPQMSDERWVWLGAQFGWRNVPVYVPAAMVPGCRLVGPALIDELTTTVLVGIADHLTVDDTGGYVIEFGSGKQ